MPFNLANLGTVCKRTQLSACTWVFVLFNILILAQSARSIITCCVPSNL